MRLLRGAAATVRQDNMQHTTYKDAAAYAALPNRVGLSTVTVEASQPASPSIPVPFFASALFRATTLGLGLRPCHIFLGTGLTPNVCPGTGLALPCPHLAPGLGGCRRLSASLGKRQTWDLYKHELVGEVLDSKPGIHKSRRR